MKDGHTGGGAIEGFGTAAANHIAGTTAGPTTVHTGPTNREKPAPLPANWFPLQDPQHVTAVAADDAVITSTTPSAPTSTGAIVDTPADAAAITNTTPSAPTSAGAIVGAPADATAATAATTTGSPNNSPADSIDDSGEELDPRRPIDGTSPRTRWVFCHRAPELSHILINEGFIITHCFIESTSHQAQLSFMLPNDVTVVSPWANGHWILPSGGLDDLVAPDWAFCVGAPMRNMLELCRLNGVRRIITSAPLDQAVNESMFWKSTQLILQPAPGETFDGDLKLHFHWHWMTFQQHGRIPTRDTMPVTVSESQLILSTAAHSALKHLSAILPTSERLLPAGPTIAALSAFRTIMEKQRHIRNNRASDNGEPNSDESSDSADPYDRWFDNDGNCHGMWQQDEDLQWQEAEDQELLQISGLGLLDELDKAASEMHHSVRPDGSCKARLVTMDHMSTTEASQADTAASSESYSQTEDSNTVPSSGEHTPAPDLQWDCAGRTPCWSFDQSIPM